MFSVTGEGCGCVSMNVSSDTTSVTCSEWTAVGQTCSFQIRTISQDCGFFSSSIASAVTLSGLPIIYNVEKVAWGLPFVNAI